MKEFLTQALPIIVQCIVTLLGIGLPIFGAYIYKKNKGNKTFIQAITAVKDIIGSVAVVFEENPNLEKTAEAIMQVFKDKMLAQFTFLNASQLDYLFNIIKLALSKMMNVDVTIFAKVSYTNNEKLSVGLKVKGSLFGVKTKPLF